MLHLLLLLLLLLREGVHSREVHVALILSDIEGHVCLLLAGQLIVREVVAESSGLAVAIG